MFAPLGPIKSHCLVKIEKLVKVAESFVDRYKPGEMLLLLGQRGREIEDKLLVVQVL
jgi:hypothetical protein